MKLFLVPSLVATVFLGTSTIQGQTGDVFEFTDGYFTSSSYGPVHLVHDDIDLRVRLGDEYDLSVGFKVNVGTLNPCSRREEKQCRLIHQVVARNSDGTEEFVAGWKVGLEFTVGQEKIGVDKESINVGLSSVAIPRTASTENTFLVVKIVKEDQEIYRKEWPIQIW